MILGGTVIEFLEHEGFMRSLLRHPDILAFCLFAGFHLAALLSDFIITLLYDSN